MLELCVCVCEGEYSRSLNPLKRRQDRETLSIYEFHGQ